MNINLLLDNFNQTHIVSKKELQETLSNLNHINAAKIIKEYHLSAPKDYVRSCGTNNFTDFPRSLSSLTHERYIVVRPSSHNLSFQYIPNFSECIEYMNFLTKNNYFLNHKTSSSCSKIKGYFNNDNQLIIGHGKYARFFELEDLNLTKLVHRNYYLDSNHLSIQAQVSALGAYLGYESILATNDKNKRVDKFHLSTLFKLTFQDLNLQNIYCKKTIELASFTDVIWADKTSKLPKYAIEVEFGGKISDCFTHFSSLNHLTEPTAMINIFLGDDQKIYRRLHEYRNLPMHKYSFPSAKLAFLSIQDFFYILTLRNKGISSKQLENELLRKLFFINSAFN